MTQFQQSQSDLVNLFYCSLEEDSSGQMGEDLAEELSQEGFSKDDLLKAQQEASKLFSSNAY